MSSPQTHPFVPLSCYAGLVGRFFREFLAPVATRFKERIDLEATLAAAGKTELKSGTVSGAWKRSLEAAGQSGAFAKFQDTSSDSGTANSSGNDSDVDFMEEDLVVDEETPPAKNEEEPKYKPLNKVIRNKGDPVAVRQAKAKAKSGQASLAVQRWLFPPKVARSTRKRGLARSSLLRFSDTKPALVLTHDTVYQAVTHLSNSDPRLASLISTLR